MDAERLEHTAKPVTLTLSPYDPTTRDGENTPPFEIQSYYRAKTFVASSGVNLLVTSAAALLSLYPRLSQTEEYQDIHELYQQLTHEIKAFESTAIVHSYSTSVVWIARFLLCTAFDDMLMNTPWGKKGLWTKYQLISSLLHETPDPDRFFVVMRGLMKDPKKFIDVIELSYLCLNIGFRGKYRHQDNGEEQLAKIANQLYQIIRHERGEFPKQLSNDNQPKTPVRRLTRVPLWGITLVSTLILLLIYSSFHSVLTVSSSPLKQQLLNIHQMLTNIDDDF